MRTKVITRTVYAILLSCLLAGFLPDVKAQEFNIGGNFTMGHRPTGQLDTVKAEIIIEATQTYSLDNTRRTLQIVEGYIEREKYGYSGDRMPNQLPNNGGVYDDYYVAKRYLDENKNEIKEFIWLSRELGKNSR